MRTAGDVETQNPAQVSSTMPQVSFTPTSRARPPHVRHHHHQYDFSRRNYADYGQIKEKMRKGHGVPYEALGAPFALDGGVVGVHCYGPKEYQPAPFYRHYAWWRQPAIRPWEHEDLLHHSRSTRGAGLNPWVLSSSANAPFATFDNDAGFPAQADVKIVPPWEKDEHQHVKSRHGRVTAASEVRTKVHNRGCESPNCELDPKHSETFDPKYPHNKWNESPSNRQLGATKFRVMSPPPPKPPIIQESCTLAAPFATRDNMVVVKYGEGQPKMCKLHNITPKPFVETHWPFERHEDDSHGKLPRRFLNFPRDPKTYEWQPFPHADEFKMKDQRHCNLKEGHGMKHPFSPGDHHKKSAAGDFGRVVYPPKLISYPRDPATYNPFPVHYAYEPEDNDKGHCGMKKGHDRGFQFYPGDPSKMPAAGQKVPPKVYPPTWDVNAPYMYEAYIPFH